MRRTLLLVIVLVGLLASACGSSDGSSTTAAPDASAPPTDGGAIEGPAAPDFTLTLGTGSDTFTLSDEAKPVYMVFWAEW